MPRQKKESAPLRVAVKYCGGCNPGYDRGALVAELQRKLKGKILLVAPHEDPDRFIAVQGCSTACADLSPFEEAKVLHITHEEDLPSMV